ncbi:MAG: IS200/IS605 family transposase [Peptococcaceae bacterium]|nr:IS200/IS605 family transposase [Peptococcaceae bacterium]
MKYQLDRGCHSVYSLRFHYVCCVKYRRKVLTPEISEYLKMVNEDIAGKFGVQIIEQETDRDHIHIIFASKPQVQLSGFINRLKSASARLIFRKFPEVKAFLWGEHFWSPSYFLSTVGEVKLEDVKRYIQSQGNP